MALKVTRRAPGWEGNITGGNTLTLRCPIGLTYHQIWTTYDFQDGVPADIPIENAVDELRVVINGEPVWRISGAELDEYNKYDSRAAAITGSAGGIICLDFNRYNLRTVASEEFTSVGTGYKPPEGGQPDPTPVTSLSIEMDLNASVVTGNVSSRFVQSEARPLGFIKKVRKFNYSINGAGDLEIADLPKGDLINRIFIKYSGADGSLTRVKIDRDNFTIFDRDNTLNDRINDDGVRTSQPQLFVVDTTEAGNGSEQISTLGVGDFRLTLTSNAAENYTVIVEYIGPIEL